MTRWEQKLKDPILGLRIVFWARKHKIELPENPSDQEIDAIIEKYKKAVTRIDD